LDSYESVDQLSVPTAGVYVIFLQVVIGCSSRWLRELSQD